MRMAACSCVMAAFEARSRVRAARICAQRGAQTADASLLWPHFGGAAARAQLARDGGAAAVGLPGTPVHRVGLDLFVSGTPLRFRRDAQAFAQTGSSMPAPGRIPRRESRTMSKFTLRTRLIREKIIGHGTGSLSAPSGCSNALFRRRQRLLAIDRLAGGPLALLHQPARQHSRSVLLQPGIEQLADFLAEIGRMAKPGKLVALQGVAGCREQELPWRLGLVSQGALQREAGVTVSL